MELKELTEVRKLFDDTERFDGKEITVGGWVRSNRDSKTVGFIVLSDGSCFQTLQIVYAQETLQNFAEIAKLNVGSAVIAKGILTLTPQA